MQATQAAHRKLPRWYYWLAMMRVSSTCFVVHTLGVCACLFPSPLDADSMPRCGASPRAHVYLWSMQRWLMSATLHRCWSSGSLIRERRAHGGPDHRIR